MKLKCLRKNLKMIEYFWDWEGIAKIWFFGDFWPEDATGGIRGLKVEVGDSDGFLPLIFACLLWSDSSACSKKDGSLLVEERFCEHWGCPRVWILFFGSMVSTTEAFPSINQVKSEI